MCALQLKQELVLLRLRGGEFKVRGRQGMGQSILEVSPTGRLALYEIVVPSRDRGLSAERPAAGPWSTGQAALSRVSQVAGMGASGADLLPTGGQVPLAGTMGGSATSIISTADVGADGADGQPQFRCVPTPTPPRPAVGCRRPSRGGVYVDMQTFSPTVRCVRRKLVEELYIDALVKVRTLETGTVSFGAMQAGCVRSQRSTR